MGKIKSVANWIFQNYEKIGAVALVLASFIGPAWGSYASPFMTAHQPLSWIAVGFAGVMAAAFIYWLLAVANGKMAMAKRVVATLEKSGVNILEDRFDKKVIRLIDFYHPQYITQDNKDFRNCEINGPSLVHFDDAHMERCQFRHVQIVVVSTGEDNVVWGATSFKSPKFIGCSLVNFTMLMNKATYDALPAEVRKYVPVINAGFPRFTN